MKKKHSDDDFYDSKKFFSSKYMVYIILLSVLFLFIYGPGVGNMLHSDDFHRIHDNLNFDQSYFKELFTTNRSDSFYRPINHLTFGLTNKFFGLNAVPYGMTNLLLGIGCIISGFFIINNVVKNAEIAAFSVWAWILAFQPFTSATTWAVGRTTLLYVFFLCLAILMSQSDFKFKAFISCFIFMTSLLSKESAIVGIVLLPLFTTGGKIKKLQMFFCALMFVLAYLYLRSQAGGMVQESAPGYYRYNYSPYFALKRGLEYLERLVFGFVPFAGLFIFLFCKKRLGDLRWSFFGFFIFAALISISPKLLIPSRSDLYVVFAGAFFFGGCASLFLNFNNHKFLYRGLVISTFVVIPLSWRLQNKYIQDRGIVYRIVLDKTTEDDLKRDLTVNQQRDLYLAREIIRFNNQ